MPTTDDAGRLLALPPGRFAAERGALAKALAEAGDPSAAAVRKLRRPTGLAWVMNRLALDRRRDVDALLAAGDRLRTGQRRALAGGGAEELRAADAELRERARALRLAGGEVIRAEGRAPPPAALSRLELLLRAAATAAGESRETFRRGALLREPDVAPGDLSGFAVLGGGAGHGAAAGDRPAAPGPAAVRKQGGSAKGAAERERRRREAAERARAREASSALARARAAERGAEAAARRAEAAARRAQEAAAKASERARTLRARADAAREETARRLRQLGQDGS